VIIPVDGKKCFQVFAPTPGVPPDPNAPVLPPAADAQVRMDICGNNLCIGSTPVGINKGPCTYSAQTDCTSVAGLPQSVVDALKTLGNVAGPIVLSGGTEAGHKTHGPGQVVFDLRMTQKLNDYVKKNATQSAASFTGCRYRLNLGGSDFWFTDESGAKGGAHWHICALGQPYWYCTNKTKTGEALPAAPNNYTPGCPKMN
jgi:hypothetical protein